MNRVALMFFCAAAGLAAYVLLDYHQMRNLPNHKRFEQWWADDVAGLEASPKLPKPWFDVREVEVFGGTPAAKGWLREIDIPIRQKNPAGKYKLEALVVPWDEDGKSGVMVQYNLSELESKNMVFELGRTMVFGEDAPPPPALGVGTTAVSPGGGSNKPTATPGVGKTDLPVAPPAGKTAP